MNPKKIEFDSIYFDVYELFSGIYAIIATDQIPQSNAGIFNLGNYTIIFDTLMDPASTRDLIKVNYQLCDGNPSFVVNSHYHFDHMLGNRLFPEEIPIISSTTTYFEMKEICTERLQDFKMRAPEELKKAKELLKDIKDEKRIIELENDIHTWNDIAKPEFQLRFPNFLLDGSFIIKGKDLELELRYIGDAHTKGDIIAFFKDQSICFMGDLLFEETDPAWFATPDPAPRPANSERLCNTLVKYSEMNLDYYIPGHGKICDKNHLVQNSDFFEEYG